MQAISQPNIYLDRMSKPLQEKLKISKFIPQNASEILDVGCADGTVTLALARLFPNIHFTGIDNNEEFINLAKEKSNGVDNVTFIHGYLRQQLSNDKRYDSVIFCSVLHEFYTYGEGISTVVKALSDAHELLKNNGVLIIRDMILLEYTKISDLWLENILDLIKTNKQVTKQLQDFEGWFGKIKSIYLVNHFLLKYMYSDNWEREGREHYVPVTFEKYDQILSLLNMNVCFKESYLLPYLHNLFIKDFNFSEDHLDLIKSTGIIVARKQSPNS